MTHKSFIFCVIGLVFFCLNLKSFSDEPSQVTTPAPPVAGAEDSFQGKVILKLTFATDGSVLSCQVLRSNAPFALDATTVDYIEKNWKWTFAAGQTVMVPFVYNDPTLSITWTDDMVPPPNLLPAGDNQRNVTLRLSFGDDGWIKDVKVIQASGDDSVDQQTAAWVKSHWHHQAYANQVVDAPFEFVRPSSTPAADIAALEQVSAPATPPAPPKPPPPPEVPAIQKLWPETHGSLPDFP